MSNKIVQGIMVILWSSAIALVLLELLLGMVLPAPLFKSISVTSDGGDYMLTDNKNLIYVPKPNSGDFNALGYRGKEVAFEKKPDVTRIVFLGDSVVEGLNVAPEQRFPELLGKKLGPAFEVVNLGVQGYNLVQEIEYLNVYGLRFHPDYVIIGITWNDLVLCGGELTVLGKKIDNMKNSSFYKHYYSIQRKVEDVLLRFHIYRYLKYFLYYNSKKPTDGNFEDVVGYSLEAQNEIRKKLDVFQALAEKQHFVPVFVFLPFTDLGKNGEWALRQLASLRQEVSAMGFQVIDVSANVIEGMRAESCEKLFFPGDCCHFNEHGHAVIAELLYNEVTDTLLTSNRK